MERCDDKGDSKARLKKSCNNPEEKRSPVNPEKQKQYDRDFLLQFQTAPLAVIRPPGLPEIPDIVLDYRKVLPESAVKASTVPEIPDTDFEKLHDHRENSYQQETERDGKKHVSLAGSVISKVSWTTEDANKELTGNVYEKTNKILNNLKSLNFLVIVSQIKKIRIDTESQLNGVADLIFEKAVSEPKLSADCARMCRCLSAVKVSSEFQPGESVRFISVILYRCQKEFEVGTSTATRTVDHGSETEEPYATNEHMKDVIVAELQSEIPLTKQRLLGNARD